MSVAENVASAGDITTFNIEHGFPEAVVRGFRSGFLTDADYHHLTQCENLDGKLLQVLIGHDVAVETVSPHITYRGPDLAPLPATYLADMKMNLAETDYDQFMANEVSSQVSLLGCCCWHAGGIPTGNELTADIPRPGHTCGHAAAQTHITPASFQDKALKKLVSEFNFLRAHSVEPLSTFLDYITYVATWRSYHPL